jgi:hypothetical protein
LKGAIRHHPVSRQSIPCRVTGVDWTARPQRALARFAAGFLVLALAPAEPGAAARPWAVPGVSRQGPQVLPQWPGQQPAGVQDLLSSADAVFKEMSRITGLPIKAPLKKKIVNRTEIRRYLSATLHAEYTPQEIHQQEVTLKAFGLVSREFNLGEFLVSFYTEQAAGLYDQHTKTMLIADWVAPDMQQMVLAHELTHALQDQNFDLQRFLDAARKDEDAGSARQAIVEGYATAAMMQKLIGSLSLSELPTLGPMMEQVVRMQTQEFPAFSGAPFFFRFQALFPYTQGVSFMQKGLSHGGWPALNQVFSRPPATTKEIFQPEVYFGGKPPHRIYLEPSPLAKVTGLRQVDENRMGELGYYTLLGQFISETEAKAIAPGWEADAYTVYEDSGSGRYALVARTRWSGAEASLAFFRDCHAMLAKKYSELAPDPRSTPETFIGRTASGMVILIRTGDQCLWAEGVPPSETKPMVEYLRSQCRSAVTTAVPQSAPWRGRGASSSVSGQSPALCF